MTSKYAAVQFSDQMVCACGNVWDMNDPDPPECRKGRKGRKGRKTIAQLFGVLILAMISAIYITNLLSTGF